jgi:hypothetical protein
MGGACVTTPIDPITCPGGSTFDPATGRCVLQPGLCPDMPCPPGLTCNAQTGQCSSASPCAGKTCPVPGQICDGATGACFDPRAPKAVTVRNFCGRDMILRYTAQQPWPVPTQRLPSGGTVTATMPCPSVSGRIYFYPDVPAADLTDNGETSFAWLEYNNDQNGVLGANLTYVDHIALPYSYRLVGGDCGSGAEAYCRTKVADLDLVANCPPGLLHTSASGVQSCLAPRTYCDNPAYSGEPQWKLRCDARGGGVGQQLMSQVAACCAAGKCSGWMCDPASNVEPHHVWACEGGPHGFDTDSPRCALFNRGLFAPGTKPFSEADDAYFTQGCVDATSGLYECKLGSYYTNAPYNDYSAWLQSPKGCPGLYTFPYDDQGSLGGYHACRATGIIVTLCEGDAPA